MTEQAPQFALWLPVSLGLGVALWFVLPSPGLWIAALGAFGAIAAGGSALGGRVGRLALWFGLVAAIGLALVWMRAERVAAPRLDRPVTTSVTGKVERVERLVGRGVTRITLVDEGEHPGLRVRVSFPDSDAAAVQSGARISLRARLMPPAPASVPGGYEFARLAWFKGIGATGRGFGEPRTLSPPSGGFWAWLDRVRGRLTAHVQISVGDAEGGVAASFVTGDQGGVPDDVAQALRDSGLTHLLSISGLHVTAVVGFVMIATRRLLALSMHAATHWHLSLIGAIAAAGAGVGYSLLAGGEVPTVRSCIAALLVLLGLALGREAITLRLVAAGAFMILLILPEALIGASFQLSFAAVTAIVALHEVPWVRERLMRREEPWWAAFLRLLAGLLLTGIVVEAALAPIGLYHFNRMGAYGAFANIIAIPLTTFVIMPLEAVALLLDPLGLAGPVWLLVKWTLSLLIALAEWTATLPGGVTLAPAMPQAAFGLMVAGGLWLVLWRGWTRLAGVVPFMAGAMWAWVSPVPDILITGVGRHVGVVANGKVHLLRTRTGDYVRDLMSGVTAAPDIMPLQDSRFARCGRDSCVADIWKHGRRLRLLATRSSVFIDRRRFEPACADADIVVSDRRLPYWCAPRWLKADRTLLQRTGGLAIDTSTGVVRSVAEENGRHPWAHRRIGRQPQ
ncbi:hypothetical protein BSL82_01660 [Tardibacter chloracetimidivorans]|uniref:Competence protein ComEC n=1 Tax=Tardibacter chloracetimidivorans TaxID=1921510 RepID=A0A1L3ZZ35_9SPHN|nr:hypothetical protein BSL82_01660 [Tardibacter chloracetimidivorans]